MTYINLFMHISSEKGVPEGAVAQIDIDEHKMLCAEIERLRDALQTIADFDLYGDYSNAYEIPKIAREALKEKE